MKSSNGDESHHDNNYDNDESHRDKTEMLMGPTNSYVPLHSNCQRLVGDKSDDDDANNYDSDDGEYDRGWECTFHPRHRQCHHHQHHCTGQLLLSSI